MHLWKNESIRLSNSTTFIPKCTFMIAFPDTNFYFCHSPLFSYLVIHLYVVLKATHFTISYLCFSITDFYYKSFCQIKKFIMFYGTSLWFGIIKRSLYIYQPQIPVDHKDRLYWENFILKGGKREPSLRKKTQSIVWDVNIPQLDNKDQDYILISIINICLRFSSFY